jgi:hypothetical protein
MAAELAETVNCLDELVEIAKGQADQLHALHQVLKRRLKGFEDSMANKDAGNNPGSQH